MIAEPTVIGIDVSRDWLDGFVIPDCRRFRLANTEEGHARLVALIERIPGPIRIAFEATGGL